MDLRKLGPSMIAIGLLCAATPSYAHAILLSAAPGFRAVVHGPNVPVRLRFNSRIDSKRSVLKLVGPGGAMHTLTIGDQTSPDTLVSTAAGLEHGSYVLGWQVLASDGHITRGEVQFSVE
ncbi:MAG: copper resistance protein CopC [Bryobacteraceae bacterium]